jgi:hypothetical protein
MLMTRKHLLLTIGFIVAGIELTIPLFRSAGLPEGVGMCLMGAGGALALFVLSWPLYRIIHLRPIGLPICPHCGKLHGNYHVPADAWPSGILVCVSCRKPTRFCMSRKRPVDRGDGIPGLYLYWPEFLGLWRPVQGSTKNV